MRAGSSGTLDLEVHSLVPLACRCLALTVALALLHRPCASTCPIWCPSSVSTVWPGWGDPPSMNLCHPRVGAREITDVGSGPRPQ